MSLVAVQNVSPQVGMNTYSSNTGSMQTPQSLEQVSQVINTDKGPLSFLYTGNGKRPEKVAPRAGFSRRAIPVLNRRLAATVRRTLPGGLILIVANAAWRIALLPRLYAAVTTHRLLGWRLLAAVVLATTIVVIVVTTVAIVGHTVAAPVGTLARLTDPVAAQRAVRAGQRFLSAIDRTGTW
jgi:hypothetical protein